MKTVDLGNIKAVAMDVDGVLTDGTFWWGPNGEEFKRFCFADVTGINRARGKGIVIALISGETSPSGMALVRRFAEKVKIADVFPGCRDKADAVRTFAAAHQLELAQICFIGDDIIDIPAMEIVGVAAAPADAHSNAKAKAHYITEHNGGHGAVREVLDDLLNYKTPGK